MTVFSSVMTSFHGLRGRWYFPCQLWLEASRRHRCRTQHWRSRSPSWLRWCQLKKAKDGSREFTQRTLIHSFIEDIGLKDAKVKPIPAKVSQRLYAFKDEPPFHLKFNYRSAVGKLNYLAQTTRPDIMYATHQITKYSLDPRQSHGEAILYLVCNLKKTHNIGLKFTPDPTKGFKCYCDSDLSGLWNKEFAPVDPSTAKSRSGWIIFYAWCPLWQYPFMDISKWWLSI